MKFINIYNNSRNIYFFSLEFHVIYNFINIKELYILFTQLLYNNFRNIFNNIIDYIFINIKLIYNQYIIVFLNDMI